MQKKTSYFFLLPSLIGTIIFYLAPIALSVYYSFHESIFNSRFSGLDNYWSLFENEAFQLALGNTLRFFGIAIPLIVLISLFLAILTVEIRASWIVLCVLLPIVIPSGSVIGFSQSLFGEFYLNWLNTDMSFVSVVCIYLWRNMGFSFIIILIGLLRMDQNQIEAARIDGANMFQIYRYIHIPNIRPYLYLATLISVIGGFRIFRDVYAIYGKFPQQNVYMIQHFMHNKFESLDYQMLSSSAFLVMAAMLAIAGLIYLAWRRPWVKEVHSSQEVSS